MKRTSETLAGEGQTPSPEQLKGRALALLGRREHSRTELRRKLLEQGGTDEQAESLLDELVERRLQSDDRFAEVFVRSRAERGYGPVSILADLKARGLSAEQAATALADSGYDWEERAAEVRCRRFGEALPESPREKARQFRFLQYRGFSGRQLTGALRGVGDDEG